MNMAHVRVLACVKCGTMRLATFRSYSGDYRHGGEGPGEYVHKRCRACGCAEYESYNLKEE